MKFSSHSILIRILAVLFKGTSFTTVCAWMEVSTLKSPTRCRAMPQKYDSQVVVLQSYPSSNMNEKNIGENDKATEMYSSVTSSLSSPFASDDHPALFMETDISTNTKRIQTKSLLVTSTNSPSSESVSSDTTTTTTTSSTPNKAEINTINQRLLADIELATRNEKQGTKSSSSLTKYFQYNPSTTLEDREARIQQARDLNGISPTTTLVAGCVAIGMGYGIWLATQFIIQLFYTHPISVDAPYIFTRVASVFRNIIIGIMTLATGFFSVTGFGIILLGLRVTQGVLSGELDPNKNQNKDKETIRMMEVPNIWEYMTMDTKRRKKK